MTTIIVRVKTLDANTHTVTVRDSASVTDLKQEVRTQTGVDVERQRLIFQGKVLKNEKDVKFYSIKDGMTIHMVERVDNPFESSAHPSPTPSARQRQGSTSALFVRQSRASGAGREGSGRRTFDPRSQLPPSFQISEMPEGILVGARIDIDDRMQVPPFGSLLSSMFGFIRSRQNEEGGPPSTRSSQGASRSASSAPRVTARVSGSIRSRPYARTSTGETIAVEPALGSERQANVFSRRRRAVRNSRHSSSSRRSHTNLNANTERLRESIRTTSSLLDTFVNEQQSNSSASNVSSDNESNNNGDRTRGQLGESLLGVGNAIREMLPILDRMGLILQTQQLQQLQSTDSTSTERVNSEWRRLDGPCATLADALATMSNLSHSLSNNLRLLGTQQPQGPAPRQRGSGTPSRAERATAERDDMHSNIFNLVQQLIGGYNRPAVTAAGRATRQSASSQSPRTPGQRSSSRPSSATSRGSGARRSVNRPSSARLDANAMQRAALVRLSEATARRGGTASSSSGSPASSTRGTKRERDGGRVTPSRSSSASNHGSGGSGGSSSSRSSKRACTPQRKSSDKKK